MRMQFQSMRSAQLCSALHGLTYPNLFPLQQGSAALTDCSWNRFNHTIILRDKLEEVAPSSPSHLRLTLTCLTAVGPGSRRVPGRDLAGRMPGTVPPWCCGRVTSLSRALPREGLDLLPMTSNTRHLQHKHEQERIVKKKNMAIILNRVFQ